MAKRSNRNSSRKSSGKSSSSKKEHPSPLNDEPCYDDNESVASTFNSLNSSIYSSNGSSFDTDSNTPLDNSTTNENNPELLLVDNFQNLLDKALDDAFNSTKKSRRYQCRINALKQISALVQSHYCCDELLDRITTLSDILERSLKQKRPDEISEACTLLTLVLSNVGEDATLIGQNLFPLLRTLLADNKLGSEIRANCAKALSIIVFITTCDHEQIQTVMLDLISIATENIAKLSTEKYDDDNVEDNFESDISDCDDIDQPTGSKAYLQMIKLTVQCIEMWAVLLGCVSDFIAQTQLNRHFKSIVLLLDSKSLEIRIAAGEAIALSMERFAAIYSKRNLELDDHFSASVDLITLVKKLKRLSTDAQKFRSKRDLRKQRSRFRQILRTVESVLCKVESSRLDDQEKSETVVRFGREQLVLDSWTFECYYAVFCQIFGSSFNIHLAKNVLIRDIFQLGQVIVVNNGGPTSKSGPSKLERVLENQATKKVQKLKRNKQRNNCFKNCQFQNVD